MVFVANLLGSVLLLAVAAFCAFGFLATFEPLPPAVQWTWRGIYIVLGPGAAIARCVFQPGQARGNRQRIGRRMPAHHVQVAVAIDVRSDRDAVSIVYGLRV